MSDKKMQEPSDQSLANDQIRNTPQPIRRKLLKGTVVVPVIMTLHSGAALARTSILVGAAVDSETAKIGDQYICAHNADLDPSGKYDLGDSPQLELVENVEECLGTLDDPRSGILISVSAYNSLQGRGFSTDL